MLVSFILFVLTMFFSYVLLCVSDKKYTAMAKLESSWEHGSIEDTTPAIHRKLKWNLNKLQGKNGLAALAINEDGEQEIITVEVVSDNTVAIRVNGKTVTESFTTKQWKNIDSMMLSFANKVAKQQGCTTMCSISC